MTDLRTAAQQALEALEKGATVSAAITLRAALAQQAEPVGPAAWANQADLISARITHDRGGQGDTHTWSETRSSFHGVPLYTDPPQRPSLTDEEIEDIYLAWAWDVTPGRRIADLARAIERAHDIGEKR